MKSDVIHISSNGNGISDALLQTEKTAAFGCLDKKNSIHLRLFAEEMMGMMKTLTGEQEADFWIEADNGEYHLHLLVHTPMNSEKREKLLGVSTSGKNDVRGFMAKVKSAFETALATIGSGYIDTVGVDVIEGGTALVFPEWTLSQYRTSVQDEEWDELEHSIVAKLADEVRVRINGSDVEMIIDKKYKKNGDDIYDY